MENTNLLYQQKVRFVVDVELLVLDHPQAMIDSSTEDPSYTSWMKESPENARKWLMFQQRLLHAVVSNADIISKIAVDDSGRAVATYFDEEYTYEKPDSLPFEQFLSPVIETLSESDQEIIQEFVSRGVFIDNTEISLFEPFKAKVINTALEILE